MNDELKTFLDSLKRAVFDRETVLIGGGEYSPEELKNIIAMIEAKQ